MPFEGIAEVMLKGIGARRAREEQERLRGIEEAELARRSQLHDLSVEGQRLLNEARQLQNLSLVDQLTRPDPTPEPVAMMDVINPHTGERVSVPVSEAWRFPPPTSEPAPRLYTETDFFGRDIPEISADPNVQRTAEEWERLFRFIPQPEPVQTQERTVTVISPWTGQPIEVSESEARHFIPAPQQDPTRTVSLSSFAIGPLARFADQWAGVEIAEDNVDDILRAAVSLIPEEQQREYFSLPMLVDWYRAIETGDFDTFFANHPDAQIPTGDIGTFLSAPGQIMEMIQSTVDRRAENEPIGQEAASLLSILAGTEIPPTITKAQLRDVFTPDVVRSFAAIGQEPIARDQARADIDLTQANIADVLAGADLTRAETGLTQARTGLTEAQIDRERIGAQSDLQALEEAEQRSERFTAKDYFGQRIPSGLEPPSTLRLTADQWNEWAQNPVEPLVDLRDLADTYGISPSRLSRWRDTYGGYLVPSTIYRTIEDSILSGQEETRRDEELRRGRPFFSGGDFVFRTYDEARRAYEGEVGANRQLLEQNNLIPVDFANWLANLANRPHGVALAATGPGPETTDFLLFSQFYTDALRDKAARMGLSLDLDVVKEAIEAIPSGFTEEDWQDYKNDALSLQGLETFDVVLTPAAWKRWKEIPETERPPLDQYAIQYTRDIVAGVDPKIAGLASLAIGDLYDLAGVPLPANVDPTSLSQDFPINDIGSLVDAITTLQTAHQRNSDVAGGMTPSEVLTHAIVSYNRIYGQGDGGGFSIGADGSISFGGGGLAEDAPPFDVWFRTEYQGLLKDAEVIGRGETVTLPEPEFDPLPDALSLIEGRGGKAAALQYLEENREEAKRRSGYSDDQIDQIVAAIMLQPEDETPRRTLREILRDTFNWLPGIGRSQETPVGTVIPSSPTTGTVIPNDPRVREAIGLPAASTPTSAQTPAPVSAAPSITTPPRIGPDQAAINEAKRQIVNLRDASGQRAFPKPSDFLEAITNENTRLALLGAGVRPEVLDELERWASSLGLLIGSNQWPRELLEGGR